MIEYIQTLVCVTSSEGLNDVPFLTPKLAHIQLIHKANDIVLYM